MESGLSLSEIDEFLGNAFLAKDAADHIFVAAGAGQGAFQGAASAIGKVIDVSGDLVGHDERQVGVRVLQFGFGFGFDVEIDGRRRFISFVDGRGLGLLFGESITLLERGDFESVDAVEDTVEFVFEAIVAAQVESAAQKLVEGGVETLFGGFEVSGVVVILTSLKFFFYAGDEFGNGIDLEFLGNVFFGLGFGGGRRGRLLLVLVRWSAGGGIPG